jgi:hypothetical protein
MMDEKGQPVYGSLAYDVVVRFHELNGDYVRE